MAGDNASAYGLFGDLPLCVWRKTRDSLNFTLRLLA